MKILFTCKVCDNESRGSNISNICIPLQGNTVACDKCGSVYYTNVYDSVLTEVE